jgi:hypothetical protein
MNLQQNTGRNKIIGFQDIRYHREKEIETLRMPDKTVDPLSVH